MLGTSRDLGTLLAAGAILLLLCGTLCLFDDAGAGAELCLLVLAVAGAALATIGLELVGQLVPALAGAPYLALAESRSPPPKR